MTENGTLISKEKQFAYVEVKRGSMCSGCTNSDCGTSCTRAELIKVKALNKVNADIGDKVKLYSKSSRIYLIFSLAFLLPIILFILSFYLFISVFVEHYAYLFSAFVFFVSFVLFAILANVYTKKAVSVEIVEIVEFSKK